MDPPPQVTGFGHSQGGIRCDDGNMNYHFNISKLSRSCLRNHKLRQISIL